MKSSEKYNARFRMVEDGRWKRCNGPAADRLDSPTVIEEMIDLTESTIQRLRKRDCAWTGATSESDRIRCLVSTPFLR